MMPLRLGDLADSIRELECLLEVPELERTFEMAGLVQTPFAVELLEQRLGAASLERRHASSARHAILIGKAHGSPPVVRLRSIPRRRGLSRFESILPESQRTVRAARRSTAASFGRGVADSAPPAACTARNSLPEAP